MNPEIGPVLEATTNELLRDMDKSCGNLLAMYFLGHLGDDVEDEDPEEYHTPEDINSGFCMIWARKAIDALGGPSQDCKVAWIDDGEEQLTEYEFAHAALFYKHRYYDSECHGGVARPIDLPFFKDLKGREELLSLTFMPELEEVRI